MYVMCMYVCGTCICVPCTMCTTIPSVHGTYTYYIYMTVGGEESFTWAYMHSMLLYAYVCCTDT